MSDRRLSVEFDLGKNEIIPNNILEEQDRAFTSFFNQPITETHKSPIKPIPRDAEPSLDEFSSLMPKFETSMKQLTQGMDKAFHDFGDLDISKDKFLARNKIGQVLGDYDPSKQGPHSKNGYSHCYSSMTQFDDKGKKMQKTHAVTTGPDGVRQEKKTLEDRDKELKQMSLGQHIKTRGVEVEKTKKGSAPIETKRTLHGIDESQVGKFEKDWSKAVGASSGLLNIGMGGGQNRVANARRQKYVKN